MPLPEKEANYQMHSNSLSDDCNLHNLSSKPVAIPLILLALTLDLIVTEDIQQLQPPGACCNLCEGKLGNLLM